MENSTELPLPLLLKGGAALFQRLRECLHIIEILANQTPKFMNQPAGKFQNSAK